MEKEEGREGRRQTESDRPVFISDRVRDGLLNRKPQ